MRGLAIVMLLAAGCQSGADSAPSCAAVVDHLLEVTKTGLTGHGNMELGNRGAMITQCEQRKQSATERRCLFAAKTMTEIAGCSAGRPAP
jgi:hypothetical protein